MIFEIILTIVFVLYAWWSISIIRKNKKRFVRIDNDINTLHRNQAVLLSMLNQFNRELQSYERQNKKSSKIFKRHVGLVSSIRREAEGTDTI